MTPSTEARIRDAVARLRYVPNHNARSLASSGTGTIGLVLPGLSNPFFAALADGIVAESAQRDLTVLLCSTRGDRAREAAYSEMLASGVVEGLIYIGMHRTNERLDAVVRAGLPVVVVDERLQGLPDVDTVVVDNYAGAFQATSHLLRLGHERIAYVGGPVDLDSVQERLRGYRVALGRVGVRVDPGLIHTGTYTEEFGVSILPHLLSLSAPPTAVFAASDFIALGLLNAAEIYGLEVPHDLSVVGFDDMPFNRNLRPRLTSVAQPVEEIARSCVELLVRRIRTPDAAPETDTLPVALAVRESAGVPRGRERVPAARAVDAPR